MANNNNGNPITPARAGYARALDIVPSKAGVVVSAAKRIAAFEPTNKHGFTLGELVTRQYAIGVGLWSRKWGAGDYSFEVRDPRDLAAKSAVRGILHVCDHTASKGSKQVCKGHNGDTCDYTFVSLGDSVTRWATQGAYEVPATLADNKATANAARANVLEMLAGLVAKFGAADVLATPSVQQCIAIGIVSEADVTALATRKASKAK